MVAIKKTKSEHQQTVLNKEKFLSSLNQEVTEEWIFRDLNLLDGC